VLDNYLHWQLAGFQGTIAPMRIHKLFLVASGLLVVGLASLWSKWNGSAGIHAGYPIEQWNVMFNGSVEGWPDMIGVVAIFAAIITFVVAVIRSLMD
jgi:hypothetical protein